MRARSARFVLAAPGPASFPPEGAPEIAFAGRSNVGKSSLLNAITGVAKLARTSSTPGRTRLINWFEVQPPGGPMLAFVDLPGFGYAKVPREMRASWRPLVEGYMSRACLKLVLVLVDARRGPEEEEAELLDWLTGEDVPHRVVLTKVDKLSKSQRVPAQVETRKALALAKQPLLFSADTLDGLDDLWRAILGAVKS